MTQFKEEVTDIQIRERLISEMGETIDRNLEEMRQGHYFTIDTLKEKFF